MDVTKKEVSTYYCELCDNDFPNEKLLNNHIKQHRVCGIDGCKFSAHEKLVEKHVKMQHRTGLYERIKNVCTPEDIKLWIEERKRKYPTKSYVDLKNKENREKRSRGEVITAQTNRKRPRFDKSQKKFRRKRAKKNPKRIQEKVEESCDEVTVYRGVRAFCGTGSWYSNDSAESLIHNSSEGNNCADDISDEEEYVNESKPTPTPKPPSLLALVDYSDSDDGPEEVPTEKLVTSNISTNANENSSETNRFSPGPKEPKAPAPPKVPKPDVKSEKNSNLNKLRRNYPPPRTFLIQKLLSKQIAHERNYICQCLHYISKNNFFD